MKNFIFLLSLFLVFINSQAQNKYTISGYVTDAKNGESIVGVNIYSKALQSGVTSNAYGFYSLTLPEGEHDISFTFIDVTGALFATFFSSSKVLALPIMKELFWSNVFSSI